MASKWLTTAVEGDEGIDPTKEERTTAQRLARHFRLKREPDIAVYTEDNPLQLGDEELELYLCRDLPMRSSGRARVWPIQDGRKLRPILDALRRTQPEDDDWSFLSHPGRLKSDGHPIILVGGFARGRKPAGICAASRSLSIWHADNGEYHVWYSLAAELIYVRPSSQGRGLGSLLTAAMAMCLFKDIQQIKDAWNTDSTPDLLRVSISGEAHSDGGEHALQSLTDFAESLDGCLDGIPCEVQVDWGI